jgi:hypothetical protein
MAKYLFVGLVVVALVLLAMWATGGVAFFLVLPILRLVPLVAGILACVAFAMIANRLEAGSLLIVTFAVPVMLYALTPVLPYIVVSRGAGSFLSLIYLFAPALSIFPALALWLVAKDLIQRTQGSIR